MPKIANVDANNPEQSVQAIGNPSDSIDYLFLGLAHFYLGEYRRAIEELSHGLNLQGTRTILTSVCTEELVTALCFLGETRSAAEAVERFGHLVDPDYLPRLQRFQNTLQWPAGITSDSMEFVVMTWLEIRGRRRPDLAEKLCKEFSKLSPSDAKVWFNLGRAYADQKKFDPAIQAFTKHLDLIPNSIDGLVSRAWCYKLAGKLRECRQDAEQIRKINPSDPDLTRLLS